MKKQQAEEIARHYIQAHQEEINGASQKDIETAVKRVAVALTGLKAVYKQPNAESLSSDNNTATHD